MLLIDFVVEVADTEGDLYRSIPAIQADMKLANVPTIMALKPSFARSDLRDGASPPMPPIWIAMELRLANPQSAKVAITKDRGSSASFTLPRSTNATNSFNTIRVPRRLPTVAQSFHSTPNIHAIGANMIAKTCWREAGNQLMWA